METLSLDEVSKLWLQVLSRKFSLQQFLSPNSGTQLKQHRDWFLANPTLTIDCKLNDYTSFQIVGGRPAGCICVSPTHYWCPSSMTYRITVIGRWVHQFWDWDEHGEAFIEILFEAAARGEDITEDGSNRYPGYGHRFKEKNGVEQRTFAFDLSTSYIYFEIEGTNEKPAVLGDIDHVDSVPWNIRFEHQPHWPPMEMFSEISARFDDGLGADEEFKTRPVSVEDLLFYRKF